ncbi:hypothetical protein [Salmonirosea aquatica]|uniref:Uncharacterized protein n=1 Tax=Salmonirosea aquatica TaxID=2654236 RepID=A0A7C9BLG3_9BACT|nr:hypothetical protein [Cytophagaceae bacterium SJW1-29]
MKEFLMNGRKHSFPENWTEVPKAQLPEVLKLVFVEPESGSTYHELLRVLLGFSGYQWRKQMRHFFGASRSEEHKVASTEALAELLRPLHWMRTDELTVPPFASITVDGQPWLLFEPGLATMSFGELTDAYIHAQAFVKQLVEGEERLDYLVATVCRPALPERDRQAPEWNGDPREFYNEHQVRARAVRLRGRFAEQKVLALVYFMGSLKDFYAHFDIFESGESGPPRKEDYPGQALIKNHHLLAEKQIFGNMAATRQANAHEVFQFLEEHHKDVKAENERIKAQNDA